MFREENGLSSEASAEECPSLRHKCMPCQKASTKSASPTEFQRKTNQMRERNAERMRTIGEEVGNGPSCCF